FEFERAYYALVNTDYEHDIGWLSRESCKPGHVPDGESLLVAQMAPDWSTATYDDPLEAISGEVAEMVAQLLGDDRLCNPDWVDDQGWRYALPDAAVETAKTDPLAAHELYVLATGSSARGAPTRHSGTGWLSASESPPGYSRS
ncbi:MAG: hypothetical protein A07HN63_01140, partial [uncultured archaeon A07HN63]